MSGITKAIRLPMNLRLPLLFALGMMIQGCASTNDEVLLFTSGFRPEVDQITHIEAESSQTISVLEDKGLVASNRERGVSFPYSLTTVERQAFRQVSGPRAPDGSFEVQLHFLSKSSGILDAQGKEHPMPEPSLTGVSVFALAGPDGDIRAGSMRIEGAPAEQVETLRPKFYTLFEQLQGVGPVPLRPGSPSTQVTKLSSPLGELGSMAMSVSTAYALQHVDAGVAQIGAELTISFDKPEGSAMTIRGGGTGTGLMNYSIESKRINAFRVHSRMTADIQMNEGTLRIEGNYIYVSSSTETGE